MTQLTLFYKPEEIGDVFTYPNDETEFELIGISGFIYWFINKSTGKEHWVTDTVFEDLINIKTGRAKWEYHTNNF